MLIDRSLLQFISEKENQCHEQGTQMMWFVSLCDCSWEMAGEFSFLWQMRKNYVHMGFSHWTWSTEEAYNFPYKNILKLGIHCTSTWIGEKGTRIKQGIDNKMHANNTYLFFAFPHSLSTCRPFHKSMVRDLHLLVEAFLVLTMVKILFCLEGCVQCITFAWSLGYCCVVSCF